MYLYPVAPWGSYPLFPPTVLRPRTVFKLLTPDFWTSIIHISMSGGSPQGLLLKCGIWFSKSGVRPVILHFLQASRQCCCCWPEHLSMIAIFWITPELGPSACLTGLVFLGVVAHYSLMHWLSEWTMKTTALIQIPALLLTCWDDSTHLMVVVGLS